LFRRFVETMIEPPTDFPGVVSGKMPIAEYAGTRSESLVVYLGADADVPRIALALQEMGDARIQTGSSALPPMTDEVLPGIRWASHPSEQLLRGIGERDMSFGQSRGTMIDRAREGFGGDRPPADFDGFRDLALRRMHEVGISTDDPSRENLERLRQLAAQQSNE
jgi:hypothetical protein